MYDFKKLDKKKLIFGSIFLLSNRLQTVMDQYSREVTAKQWFVIMALGMFDQPPTLKQLAAVCDSSHQNIKQLVLKLSEKGFIKIEEDFNDHRAMRIIATEKCEQWDKENKDFTEYFLNTLFDELTEEEIKILSAAQLKIYEKLEDIKENGL